MRVDGTASQVEVVIVGAGQAGLAVSYYLRAFGVEHVVLERGRAGESWRSRWDSFTLVTPNWMNRLPGYQLTAGAAREFLPRDTAVGLLDDFARGLPVHTGTEVLSVEAGDGGYDVITAAGRIATRAVVVASGGQRRPLIPALASALPADIHQFHAGHYRNPAALPPGAVLVVGSGQSGMQIATDLVLGGREVLMATSQVSRVPRRYRGRDIHEWSVELGLYDQPAEAVTDPAEFRRPHPMLSGAHGGQTLSYQQLARDGVRLLGRLAGAEGYAFSFGPELPANVEYADQAAEQFRRVVDGYVARAGIAAPPPDTDPAERPGPAAGEAPRTLNARAERISTVLWCTGFGPDTGWLRVPVLRPDGAVEHARGVTAFPGLYVAGHPWLSNRGSGLLYGVAADAARIAQHIAMSARPHAGRAIPHPVFHCRKATIMTTSPLRLDRLIRARAIHSMTGEAYRAVGLRGAGIVAASAEPDGLDDLAGAGTVTTDAGDLTLLPAFADSHEHLMEASRNTLLVPVDRARSIAEFTAMVAAAARAAAPGEWIMTSMAWHESNLAENRLPSGAELDAAAPANPVLARRGGHLAVANTAALAAAGIGPGTPDPPGGQIGREADGRPDGVLEGGAVWQVAAFAPSPSQAQLAEALARGSAAYAALGVGTIREAMINTGELLAYQDAAERGTLSVRVRPLIRVGNELTPDQATALIDGLGVRSGFGDDWLRIWGLKFVMDGGVEGGALEQPYTSDPAQSGHLNWDPAAMTEVCTGAVRRGWRIGTHAAGDRAVRTVLDVYEAVAAAVKGSGPLPPWTLVIEHALLSDPAQRKRVVHGGFGLTVQHSLLWNMGSEMLQTWGPERTRQVNPLDEWLALGADLAAGTDIARPFNPLLNVWGMATRCTKAAGIQGPEHAISVATALELYTMGTARLNHDQDRLGSIAPGKLADIVAYPADPLTADVDDLPGLTPAFTIVGGRPVHDPGGRLGPPR